MKKILMLATAALLITGASFANGGDKEKKAKSKKTCTKGGKCCGKHEEKEKKS